MTHRTPRRRPAPPARAACVQRLETRTLLSAVSDGPAVPTVPKGGPAEPQALEQSRDLIGLSAMREDRRFAHLRGRGTVAIVDTGVDTSHPDFGGRASVSTTGTSAGDLDGHGTHVAATAAGRFGVAPGAGVWGLDADYFDANTGSHRFRTSAIEAALQEVIAELSSLYVVGESPVVAVNMSLGGGEYEAAREHPDLHDEFQALADFGVPVVVAAGNDWVRDGFAARNTAGFAGAVENMAADPLTITVSSVLDTHNGSPGGAGTVTRFAETSMRHRDLTDVLAPGEWIYAAVPGGGHDNYYGTSMAAPHVTGAVALMQQFAVERYTPNGGNGLYYRNLEVAEIRGLLRNHGTTVVDGAADGVADATPSSGHTYSRLNLVSILNEMDRRGDPPKAGDAKGGQLDFTVDQDTNEVRIPASAFTDTRFGVRLRPDTPGFWTGLRYEAEGDAYVASFDPAAVPVGTALLADLPFTVWNAAGDSRGGNQNGVLSIGVSRVLTPNGSIAAATEYRYDAERHLEPGQVDVLSMVVRAGETVTFAANTPLSDLDPTLTVFDAAGVVVRNGGQDAFNDDRDLGDYDSLLTFTFPRSETVYVAVAGYGTQYDPVTGGVDGYREYNAGEYRLEVRRHRGIDAGPASVVGQRVDAGGNVWQVDRRTGDGADAEDGAATRRFGRTLAGDFNGDGVTDTLGYVGGTRQAYVLLGGEAGPSEPELWAEWDRSVPYADVLVGDFNGDGRDDLAGRDLDTGYWTLAASDGTRFLSNIRAGRWAANREWDVALVDDFNGDGLDDILGRFEGGSGLYVSIGWDDRVADGDAPAASLSNYTYGALDRRREWSDFRTGDFDGDGSADVVARLDSGSVYAGFATGMESFDVRRLTGFSRRVDWSPLRVGDFNGDGRDDVAARHRGTAARPAGSGVWYVAASAPGAATVPTGRGGWDPSREWADVLVADFDGDGRDDLLGRLVASGAWYQLSGRDAGRFAASYAGRWDAAADYRGVHVATGYEEAAAGPAAADLLDSVFESGDLLGDD